MDYIKFTTLAILTLNMSSNAKGESLPFDKGVSYEGCWRSTTYNADRGILRLHIEEMVNQKLRVKYRIEGSDVFDGFPFPNEKSINFEFEFKTKIEQVSVNYQFPNVWFAGLIDKKTELSGSYKTTNDKIFFLDINNDDIEIQLTVSDKKISGKYSYLKHWKDTGIFEAFLDKNQKC